MRAFYKQILSDFHIYCGNRSQMRDWSDDELSKLLDVLCRVSTLYAYIADEDQQKIINACLIKDLEYTTLNARTVAKWLEQNGKQYFKEVAHQPTVEYEPATPEQVAMRLKEWEQMLAKTTTQLTSPLKGNGERMREQFEKAGIVKPPKIEQEEIEALNEMIKESEEKKNL